MKLSWIYVVLAQIVLLHQVSPNILAKQQTQGCSYCNGYDLFASDLGIVIEYSICSALSYLSRDSTILIYYSGDSGTYGTPYTSFPNAVTDITSDGSIRLYPTLNDGSFTLETNDGIQLPYDFIVYDLQGKKSQKYLSPTERK